RGGERGGRAPVAGRGHRRPGHAARVRTAATVAGLGRRGGRVPGGGRGAALGAGRGAVRRLRGGTPGPGGAVRPPYPRGGRRGHRMEVLTRLVDGHCHPVLAGPVPPEEFAMWCTEASVPAPAGVSYVDSQLGLAVRRWCAPVLDLPAGVPVGEYLARRAEL